MATISTSGISALQVIKSEHLLRIITTLNGSGSNDIVVSGSSNLKVLYAPSMVGPTQFTGSFSATHTTDNQYIYAITGINSTNSGSGIYGSSQSGTGIYAFSNIGTGISINSYSGPIAKFASNTGYQQMKLFNNGNLLLNTYNVISGDQTDTGYKLYVGGNTYITGSFNVTGSTASYGFPNTVLLQNPTGSSGAVLELRNTSGSISAGHTLGTIQFSGLSAGTNYASSQIRATAYQSPSSGNGGGGILSFWTALPNTGASPLERMRISEAGNVGIGTTNVTDTLTVQGTTKITGSLTITGSFIPPVMTSASRAAIVSPPTGSIVYQNDSVTGLYVYKGTSWVNLTSSEIYAYFHASFTPAASSNYYIGNFPDTSPNTNSTSIRGRIIAQHTGQIVSAVVATNMGTNATGEASTFTMLNITKSTSAVISSTVTHTADSLATYTLASPLAVTEGDILSIQWTTPAWVTAPTNLRQRITMKTLVTN